MYQDGTKYLGLLLAVMLTACTAPSLRVPAPGHHAASSSVVSKNSVKPEAASSQEVSVPAPISSSAVINGTGKFVAPPVQEKNTPPASGNSGFQLAFTDVEISQVVASVLGEGLGLNYSIDPSIKGTMSLKSSRPLTTEELLPALEEALRIQDIALVKSHDTYLVVPIKDAPRNISSIQTQEQHQPGYAVQVVMLQYTGASEMEKMLRPFAPPGGIIRVDETRNMLLLAGSSQDLDSMMEVIRTFDVDWLAGMSYAMYTLNYVDARTAKSELSEIFADPKSPISGIVKLITIPRLNAILVITPQQKYLSDVENWIKRLDVGGTGPGRRIFVYDVQYGKAEDIAKSLNKILSLDSSGFDDTTTSNSNPSLGMQGTTMGALGALGGRTDTNYATAAPAVTQPPPRVAGNVSGGNALENGSLRIVPNNDSNSLLILASPGEFSVIQSALQRLDTPNRQVLIDASLAEVTLTNDLRYGIQWSYLSKNGPVTLANAGSSQPAQQFPGFSYLYTGNTSIQAVLNALESITTVKVISSPKLVTLNNHEAELQVGDEVPVTTQSAVGVSAGSAPIVNSVEMRDTGVILRVTPRVNKNGLVQLDISQEVSNVTPTTTSGIDSPTIQQRRLSSTVVVRDGDTIALGGLIREDSTRSKSGVPILSRIPIVGSLFRDTTVNSDRTELILLITPRVMRDDSEFQSVMDNLREQFKALQPVFKTTPKH